jgi:hypothetical protein
MRQRFLPSTAGDRQGLPEQVLAPHRGLESMGPWMTTLHFFFDERGDEVGLDS